MIPVWPLLTGLAVGALALLPARLLLPVPPLSAAGIAGSVWQAKLTGAAIGNARIGQIDLTVQPGALLQGRLQWRMAGALSGSLFHSVSGGGGDGLSGTLPGTALPGLPLAGITLAGARLMLDVDGRCRSASGQIDAALSVALAGQTRLSGAPRCEASMLLLPLASPDGRVRLEVRITAQGWQGRLAVAGTAPAEALALAAAGFGRADGELVLNHVASW